MLWRAWVCLLAVVLIASTSAQDPDSSTERAKLIAALERLMMTGHPGHTSHDEGARLQEAVDEAIRQKDAEIERLAYRAAVPLVATIPAPVSSIDAPLGLLIRTPHVLDLPYGVRYKADVFASVDGGEPFFVKTAPGKPGTIDADWPAYARQPGMHHVRVHARIAYEKTGPVTPPDETRQLPDVFYARFDPKANTPGDARMFVMSPAWTSAQQISPSLPDTPFLDWLKSVLSKHLGKTVPQRDWLSEYCDARLVEQDMHPRTQALCVVAYFSVRNGVIGQIWIRTGRIDSTGPEVRWIPEAPSFEGLILSYGDAIDVDDLSLLPALLQTDPKEWPKGDASVAPEDIVIGPSRSRAGCIGVTVTVRNAGGAILRNLEVEIIAVSTDLQPMNRTGFVIDIPRSGSTEVTAELPMPSPYGAVTVSTFQLSEHSSSELPSMDPTPDDAHAFRIVNPREAPADFASRVRRAFGSELFRGY